jgi:hypothetical protein
MDKIINTGALVLALGLLGACGASPAAAPREPEPAREESAPAAAMAAPAPPPPPPSPANDDQGVSAPGQIPFKGHDNTVDPVTAVRTPILIYTAELTMAVFEVNASIDRVEGVGQQLGGFLARRDDTSITIRVPVAVFKDAVKRIEAVGDTLHRNVMAEDVTEQYRDLEVRLKSARAVHERLIQLLARATKVEDSLAVERELDRIAGEIERIEGRLKFLRDRAAFSTITVRFEAKASEQVGTHGPSLPVPWLNDINLPRLLRL